VKKASARISRYAEASQISGRRIANQNYFVNFVLLFDVVRDHLHRRAWSIDASTAKWMIA
jgi:hypothetical protein